ncbi:MAG: methyltransferase [bacterium]|nr:methyltransferase [bacterium]
MNHYFTNENLKSEIKKVLIKINNKTFTFNTDLGVFSKKGLDFGSRTLINALLKENLSGRLLDVGCGYGTIGIILSTFFSLNTDMIDINKRAVHLAELNIKENKVQNCKAFVSDIYSDVNEKYDYIVTNPPIRAGKDVVYKILFEASKHLNKNGALYFVINKNQGALSTKRDLEKVAKVEFLEKNKGFYCFKATF